MWSLTVADAAGRVSVAPSHLPPGLGARKDHPTRNDTESERKCQLCHCSAHLALFTPSCHPFPRTSCFLPSWTLWQAPRLSGSLCRETSTVTPGAGLSVFSQVPPSCPLFLCIVWCNRWDLVKAQVQVQCGGSIITCREGYTLWFLFVFVSACEKKWFC